MEIGNVAYGTQYPQANLFPVADVFVAKLIHPSRRLLRVFSTASSCQEQSENKAVFIEN